VGAADVTTGGGSPPPRAGHHSLVIAPIDGSAKTLKALGSSRSVNSFLKEKSPPHGERALTVDKPYDPI
jgi:hypothetical protein